ncbi:hypothetical protein LIER_20030 [Lithospermum erythrorhizon]|uniref:Uncharacterized protein n=1 Tax=Lithospermum erythrorhizon TaxID=34254 RepID=A0AAV3QJW7_LITER
MAKYGKLSRSRPCNSVEEARGRLDKCHPGWTALKPRRPTSFVFFDHKPQSHEDITFFLSLCTKMVGFRFRDQFAVEVYHPHHFSCQLGFAPSIPGIRNEIRATADRKASPVSISEDRDPKHAKGVLLEGSGFTHAVPTSFLGILSDQQMEVFSSLSGGICTEVLDTGESHAETDEVILLSPEAALVLQDGTGPGAASAGEYPACMAGEIGSILASFKALAEFSRQDLSYHGKKLNAIFSKARHIKKV